MFEPCYSNETQILWLTMSGKLFYVGVSCFFISWITHSNGRIIFPDENQYRTGNHFTGFYGEACATNKREQGKCLSPADCPTFMALLRFSEHPKVCFWQDVTPAICCPVERRITQRVSWTMSYLEPTSQTTTDATTMALQTTRMTISEPNKNLPFCGTSTFSFRRVNSRSRVITTNKPSLKGDWPWMAVILVRNEDTKNYRYLCGGIIISDRFIMSAAHCFMIPNYLHSQYIVRVGGITLSDGEEYTVQSIILHPSFDPRFHYHDIALLRLETPILFSNYIRPICLPILQKVRPHMEVIVTGFGSIAFGGKRSESLLAADVQITSTMKCNKAYATLKSNRIPMGITKDLICAGSEDGDMDSCQSDSGGPLVYYNKRKMAWFVIGIVSFGHKCGDPKFPGVYTNIRRYLKWVLSIVDLNKSTFPTKLSRKD